ncbi:DISARM system phospholipase D-like protein DrmC [Paenarthrobacter sp. CCNWLY172]|uniref:DISARM system phospholipase D-like protein DrmC n=1 Tax=unclassified Paenarthrobacter TaxID=2634190 RepID=UPI0030774534
MASAAVEAYAELGRILVLGELKKMIAAFEMGQSCKMAARQLSGNKAQIVNDLLSAAGLDDLPPQLRSGMFRALQAARQDAQAEIETVWTMPAATRVAGLRTSAMFHEIAKAKEAVLASTFNIQLGSPMMRALRDAAVRGVAVTLMATPGGDQYGPSNGAVSLAIQISHEIPGCKLLTLGKAVDGSYQVLHSKFVVVDTKWAFVGSANFSEAASSKNVELGLQVHSATLARKITRDVQAFETQGVLVHASDLARNMAAGFDSKNVAG